MGEAGARRVDDDRPDHGRKDFSTPVGRRLGASITRMPILLPSADASTPVPDPSSILMGVLLVELRALCLTLTLENACRSPDAVGVAEPPCRRRSRRRYVNCRNIPIWLIDGQSDGPNRTIRKLQVLTLVRGFESINVSGILREPILPGFSNTAKTPEEF